MHIPLAGNAALFSRVLKMGAAAIRADNHRFVVLSFIGIGFLVLFLGAHPASLRTNSSSMIAMPNALSLHARHFPFVASPSAQSAASTSKQSSTIPLHFAASTHQFECMLRFSAGQTQKARALYDEHKNTTCTTGHLHGIAIRYLSIFVRNESIEIEWDRRIDSQ